MTISPTKYTQTSSASISTNPAPVRVNPPSTATVATVTNTGPCSITVADSPAPNDASLLNIVPGGSTTQFSISGNPLWLCSDEASAATVDFFKAQSTAVRSALLLPRFRAAVARVRAAAGDAKIAFVGDSTTAGIGSSSAATIPSLQSYPSAFAKLLSAQKVTASDGMAVPPSILSGNPDQRWMAGTGWSQSSFGAASGADWQSTNPTGALTFADSRVAWDRCTIYYLTGSGLGSLSLTATGNGTPVTQSTSGAQGIGSVTISAGTANAGNLLTINATGNVHVVGVEPWRSTMSTVRIGNFGVGSSTTSDWTNAPSGFGGIPLIETYAPDLTVISLGINDGNTSIPVDTYIANITQLISAFRTVSDVVLCSMPPSEDAPASVLEVPYVAALSDLADALDIPFFDIFNRLGASYQTSLMHDNFHPNDIGYQDWACGLMNYLSSVI